ncbi:hypothetical protein ACOMHN_037739 [Nucella lapillus]
MASTYLTTEFVERRISSIPPAGVSETWDVDRSGHYYQLDLKMCRISTLHFDFEWGSERDEHFYQLDLKMCRISALHFDFEWGSERSNILCGIL